jgi:hypothetical protein
MELLRKQASNNTVWIKYSPTSSFWEIVNQQEQSLVATGQRLLGSTCGQDPESKQKWRPHYLCLFHHPFRAPYSAVSLYHEQLLLQGFFHLGRSTYK